MEKKHILIAVIGLLLLIGGIISAYAIRIRNSDPLFEMMLEALIENENPSGGVCFNDIVETDDLSLYLEVLSCEDCKFHNVISASNSGLCTAR